MEQSREQLTEILQEFKDQYGSEGKWRWTKDAYLDLIAYIRENHSIEVVPEGPQTVGDVLNLIRSLKRQPPSTKIVQMQLVDLRVVANKLGLQDAADYAQRANLKIDDLRICVGCGRLSIEPLGTNEKGEPYLACCPDNRYMSVKEYWYKSILKGDIKPDQYKSFPEK